MYRNSLARFLLALAITAPVVRAQGHEYRELELDGGGSLRYAVSTPADYDSAATYPVLLALPPGQQNEAMVEAGFTRYWGDQSRRAGWVVVSPVAPDGIAFWRGAERHIPALLVRIRETFRIEDGRMHLAGASNGGRSAFRVATQQPYQFQSLTVLPGYPPTAADAERLGRLRGMRVRMFVGGNDGHWVDRSKAAAKSLMDLDVDVELAVLDGEGHVPPSLDGDIMMGHLEALRRAGAPTGPTAPIERALDDFHDAAAKGDEERYFGLFAPEGVFLGTDATERWTLEEFQAFALPYFKRPSAWIYVPQSRHVQLSPEGDVAWFDEELGHQRLGVCRGTGVLREIDGAWKVAHYNLTVPVPNDLMGGVARRIQAFENGAPAETVTVVLVRHAEKESAGDDPGLTEQGRNRARILERALRSLDVDAVYTSEYRRNAATAAPLCEARGLERRQVSARDTSGLVAKLRAEHGGQTVVVVGHSNTIPQILRMLGVTHAIEKAEYDDLYVVAYGPDTRWMRLHYGM